MPVYLVSLTRQMLLQLVCKERVAKMKWIDVNEDMPRPYDSVYVAGEMKYNYDKEVSFFTDIGWWSPQYEDEEDWRKWTMEDDWYEGQEYFKITHWAEIPEIKHPKL